MSFRAALSLVRLPNGLSAAGQILAGTALAGAAGGTRPGAPALVAGSLGAMALYAFGMALNDWYDRDRDRILAPDRPIPRGLITPGHALAIALGLLVSGLLLFALAEPLMLLAGAPLVLAIVAYDGPLKARPCAAAFAMGLCRALCALSGLILGGLFTIDGGDGVMPALLTYPASYLLLITLVTAVSQQEEADAPTGRLAVFATLTGAAFLLPALGGTAPEIVVPGLLLALLVARPGLGREARAGLVVKQAIFALPLFDALWALPADRGLALACALLYLLGFPLRALLGQRRS